MRIGTIGVTILLAGCVSCASCGDGRQSTAELEGNWWLARQGSCEIFCDGSAPPPECATDDCAVFSIQRFTDGTALNGAISLSRRARQFTRLGPFVTRDYAADGEVLHYRDPDVSVSYTLEEDRLLVEQQPFDLAGPQLATALDRALEDDEWSMVEY